MPAFPSSLGQGWQVLLDGQLLSWGWLLQLRLWLLKMQIPGEHQPQLAPRERWFLAAEGLVAGGREHGLRESSGRTPSTRAPVAPLPGREGEHPCLQGTSAEALMVRLEGEGAGSSAAFPMDSVPSYTSSCTSSFQSSHLQCSPKPVKNAPSHLHV